jgi:hypothetical protein
VHPWGLENKWWATTQWNACHTEKEKLTAHMDARVNTASYKTGCIPYFHLGIKMEKKLTHSFPYY